jgi:hypothetical protein
MTPNMGGEHQQADAMNKPSADGLHRGDAESNKAPRDIKPEARVVVSHSTRTAFSAVPKPVNRWEWVPIRRRPTDVISQEPALKKRKRDALYSVSAATKGRIEALQTTLQTLNEKYEKLEYGLLVKKRRSEVGGTELVDEPEREREERNVVFLHYDMKEKERMQTLRRRLLRAKRAFATAEKQGDNEEKERLSGKISDLEGMIEYYKEEEREEDEGDEHGDTVMVGTEGRG